MENISKIDLPLLDEKINAGLPVSFFGDNLEAKLNLNDYVIKNPMATFFVKVSGDSMINAGIFSNDLLVVDKSLNPRNGSIVVANINGELTVKRLNILQGNKVRLLSENNKYKPIIINAEENFSVWGVVTYVIHSLT